MPVIVLVARRGGGVRSPGRHMLSCKIVAHAFKLSSARAGTINLWQGGTGYFFRLRGFKRIWWHKVCKCIESAVTTHVIIRVPFLPNQSCILDRAALLQLGFQPSLGLCFLIIKFWPCCSIFSAFGLQEVRFYLRPRRPSEFYSLPLNADESPQPFVVFL